MGDVLTRHDFGARGPWNSYMAYSTQTECHEGRPSGAQLASILSPSWWVMMSWPYACWLGQQQGSRDWEGQGGQGAGGATKLEGAGMWVCGWGGFLPPRGASPYKGHRLRIFVICCPALCPPLPPAPPSCPPNQKVRVGGRPLHMFLLVKCSFTSNWWRKKWLLHAFLKCHPLYIVNLEVILVIWIISNIRKGYVWMKAVERKRKCACYF